MKEESNEIIHWRLLIQHDALAHLHAAEILGAQSVRIDAVLHGGDQVSDEALEYIAGRYRSYADRAAEGGYWVGPENHSGFALRPKALARVSEAVNHPHYASCFIWEGDSKVARWVRHTHVDWRTLQAPNAALRLSNLMKAGYDGYWAVEYNAPRDQLAAIEAALARLRSLLQETGPDSQPEA
ncbi:hypothetical protein ABEX25_10220 [Paenibacillus thiaminolyticus]|uniref:sugar phosphate isomerase/epimerase family protein n=1 Tax=Paenibacillus thiaminolyticus TaxID=49283 RepID=UPI003D287994